MGEQEAKSFKEFLEEKGVDLSPEFKPKKRVSLRDSVRRLREMNLGLAVLAVALLAAGAAFWTIERPDGIRAEERTEGFAELVLQSSPAPGQLPPAPVAPPEEPAQPRVERTDAPPEPVYHVVRQGDTLIGIASKYYGQGWRWIEIARANPQTAADSWKLKVGAKLLIPQAGQ